MSKTIQEVKNDKNKIESDILRMLIDFEKSSEMKIDHIRVTTDHHTYDKEELARNQKKKLRKLKGVLDVTINLNIENDPRSVDIAA
jgi:hypothetical protein